MDLKTILIIALIIFVWYDYTNPAEGRELLDNAITKVKSVVPFPGQEQCPTNYDPVCDLTTNTTYDNSCIAGKAGILEATAGVCL